MSLASLFISKNETEIELIRAFCQKTKILIHAKSLISFEKIEITEKPRSEVYFFGSKNAFDFAIENKLDFTGKTIACVGEATKKHIENLGFEVAFYSENAGNPLKVAEELKTFLQNRKVSFFQSDLSKKSISNLFDTSQKEDVILYKTNLHAEKFNSNFDCYIFTSPSNVDAFLLENKIPPNSKIIAWGTITEKALTKNKLHADFVLKTSKQEELIGVLELM